MDETTQDSRRARALNAARQLRNKTIENGCTEEEAMLAAKKVAELMAQYRLTQTDLEIEQEPVDQHEVIRRQRQKQVSEDSCISGINRYCGTKAWFSTRGARRNLIFFGLRTDTELAEWLYKMIGTTIMSEAERFKAETRGGFYTVADRLQMVRSFRMGMSIRINERLIEMARALEPDAKTSSGTALVVVRNAVVNDAYAKLGLKLRASKGRPFRGGDAFVRGREAGDRVGLHRPVGASRPRGLLK